MGASVGAGMIWNPRKLSFEKIRGNIFWIVGKVITVNSSVTFILINVYDPFSL